MRLRRVERRDPEREALAPEDLAERALDLYPLALILVEPMGSYRSIRQTFGRVPDDIDDERFVAAWVQAALALARHYGIKGA